ncbi:hypothetical protein CPB86DRAFT_873808 [Serendipita vermifera]|nr:hypothetical protein CPB86DRAFT_873808 [Serendipita vermifera]
MRSLSSSGFGLPRRQYNILVRRREAEIKRLEGIIKDMQNESDEIIADLRHGAAEEITKLEELIKQVKSNTDNLVSEQEETLRKKVGPIYQDIGRIRRENDLALAWISPIGKLPNEILSLIFQFYVEMNQSVYGLIQVSERWKQIALSTVSLWSRILILSGRYSRTAYTKFVDGTHKRYYSDSKHVCFNGGDLIKASSRAGVCPLEISIVYVGYDEFTDEITRTLVSSIVTLMDDSILKRIRHLHVSISHSFPTGRLPEAFQHISLPNLTSLVISNMPRSWFCRLLQSISKTTKHLRHFTCAHHDFSSRLSDRIWSGLESYGFHGTADISEVDSLIDKISNVKEVKGFPTPWPSPQTPNGTFLELQKTTLNTDPRSIRSISWPKLKHLEVNDIRFSNNAPQVFAEYPMLQSLRLVTYRPHEWLSDISMPELTTLHLSLNSSNHYTSNLIGMPLSICPRVKELKLYTQWSDTMTITLLEALPNVVMVAIIPLEKHVQCGLELLLRLNDYSDGLILCPQLENLTLGQIACGINGPKALLEPLIQRTIENRMLQGSSLQKIEVLWGNSREYEAFPQDKIEILFDTTSE